MKKWGIAALVGLCAVGIVFAACGGGGDDDDSKTPSTTKTIVKKTATATSKSGTPGTQGTGAADTTPGATGTVSVSGGTPAVGTTPVPGQTVSSDASPQVVATVDPANPYIAPAPTPSDEERAYSNPDNGIDPELIGGDPSTPPEVVTDLPPVPPGATIDPPTVAAVNVSPGDVEYIIDANASESGIQPSRTIKVGDVIRVGVVLSNIPGDRGLAAFNFELRYDISKIVAPTIEGGSSLGRNPDINEVGLNGSSVQWDCALPAPQGDADEPGGYAGDGDPATGQSIIGCTTPGTGQQTGTVVLATVLFQAIAPGTVTLTLGDDSNTASYDFSFNNIGDCGFQIPLACRSATITVTN